MAEQKHACYCRDCEKQRFKEQQHLDHQFYKDAQEYREQERVGQILKGAAKYPEPFNPQSWTAKQLLQHAMQENIDQGHYIYGLFEKIDQAEQAYKNLLKDYTDIKTALKDVAEMDAVGFPAEYVVKRYAEYAREILKKGEKNND